MVKYFCPGYPLCEVGHPKLRPFPQMFILLGVSPLLGEQQEGLDHTLLDDPLFAIHPPYGRYLTGGKLRQCEACVVVGTLPNLWGNGAN